MNPLKHPNLVRQLASVVLLIMLALPLYALEKPDSVFTFRFYSGSDNFYAPGLNNGEELDRLFTFVDQNKDKIKSSSMYLFVDGFCVSATSIREDLALAKIRSNRVKSELITRKGLTEDCFVTHNHDEAGEFVIVRAGRLNDSYKPVEPSVIAPKDDFKEESAVPPTAPEVPSVEARPEITPDSCETIENTVQPVQDTTFKIEKSDSPFALKTNLLYYAALMPSIEGEWKFADRWSVALEWQGAWWSKSSPRKVYRLTTVIPEVRYWVINRGLWHGMYVGAFVGGGKYDLSNTKKGHQGEGFMAGASVGYMWPVSKHLSLDAAIGLGYLRARDKEYIPVDGHFLYQLTKNINYVGPLRLKLSLVWRIPM